MNEFLEFSHICDCYFLFFIRFIIFERNTYILLAIFNARCAGYTLLNSPVCLLELSRYNRDVLKCFTMSSAHFRCTLFKKLPEIPPKILQILYYIRPYGTSTRSMVLLYCPLYPMHIPASFVGSTRCRLRFLNTKRCGFSIY